MKAFTIFAGPNGSGKSTLTDYLRRGNADLGVYINPDEISVELRQEDKKLSQYDADRIAQRLAKERRVNALTGDVSFCYETVMSHESHIDFMLEAKASGFQVQLYYVGTSHSSINIERVRLRVEKGGHDVPVRKIVSRYNRSMALLPQAMVVADRGVVWDNSHPDFKPNAQLHNRGRGWTLLAAGKRKGAWGATIHKDYQLRLSAKLP